MSKKTEEGALHSSVDLDDEDLVMDRLAGFHHTRIPVYEQVRDKVVGILLVKDLVPALINNAEPGHPDIRELIEKPFFVPETKRARSLL